MMQVRYLKPVVAADMGNCVMIVLLSMGWQSGMRDRAGTPWQ